MMEFLTNKPQSKEQLMPLPHLWNTEQAGGLEAFLHVAAQNFEVVLKIQDQI